MTPDERLTELEVRSAHLEHQVEELSEVLYRQQRELDDLKTVLRGVQDRVGASEPGLIDAAREDKPPHY
jgi:SlyX protein